MINDKNSYLAMNDILLSSTMLSNNFNEQLEKDTLLIIDFVSKVFNLKEKDVLKYQDLVLNDLTILSTDNDVEYYVYDNAAKDYPKISEPLYLKAKTIIKLSDIYSEFQKTGKEWFAFDYRNLRDYYPGMRFEEIENASTCGNIDINKVTAILLALGIGCKKNVGAAINRFKQCAYWGDVSSLFYLAYLYQEKKDEKQASLYQNLASLSDAFLEGRTMLSKEEAKKYDEETRQNYVIISSIKQDIVLAESKKNIDYSFVEVILLDSIDYYTKMGFINKYNQKEWKEITNSSFDPKKKLGFHTKGGNK